MDYEKKGFRLDRRTFIRGLGLMALPITETGLMAEPVSTTPIYRRMVSPALEQLDCWRVSSLSNEDFIKHYEQKLKKIRIGTSFSPEQYEYLARREDPSLKHNFGESREGLEMMLADWEVREVRLGLRRDQIFEPDGDINLLKYHPYIALGLEYGANIMQNIGPTKVFRAKEDHIPFQDALIPGLLPPNGSIITLNSPFGQYSLEQADKILVALKTNYPGAKFDIQPDNEPKNSYGRRKYTFDDPYLSAIIEKANFHYPESKILLNSMGGLNISEISSIFQHLVQKNPHFKNRLINGTDFYYTVPEYYSNILKKELDLSLLPVLGNLDLISLSRMLQGSNIFLEDYVKGLEFQYLREVTENQVESWGRNREPGKSARQYRFTLARCMDNIFFLTNRPDESTLRVIRDWGDEALVMSQMNGILTREQAEIIELKKYINSQRQAA